MKIILSLLLACQLASAETKISQLPAVAGASVGSSDYFPFAAVGTGLTSRILFSELFSVPGLGTLPAARLPNPTSSTLGGIRSYAAVTNEWINAISTSGVPSSARPACASLSNAAASCSTDATNATNISSGTLAKARGGAGADMSSVTFPSSGTLATTFSNSSVVADTGNGHGSGSTKIRRLTNFTTVGTDITCADSSTLGTTCTINTTGTYSITYVDFNSTTTDRNIGVSLNSSQLTTSITSITKADRLAQAGAVAGNAACAAVTWNLTATDVIRPHTDGAIDGTGAGIQFRITRIR